MRRVLLVGLVLIFAMPAAAGAIKRGPGDGTLVVQAGQGVVIVQARGIIWGRFLSGTLVIDDRSESHGRGPVVYGAEKIHELSPTRTLYRGEDVHFSLIGGTYKYKVRVDAVGLDVNAVGQGFVILDGSRFTDPGRFSLDGGPFQPMPSVVTRLPLGAPPQGTLGSK